MDDLDLRVHRVLKAPRKLVWECWTTPAHMKHWFIPRPHEIPEIVMDLRPGGRFFTLMRVNGQDHPNDGSILHVDPGRQLVFTDLLLADWKPVDQPGLGFTAILTLADHPDGTDYTAVARHRTPESCRRHEEMGFHDGWGTVATQLEAYAQGLVR